MEYNLTEYQRDALRWLVEEVRAKRLYEEFRIYFEGEFCAIWEYSHPENIPATLTPGTLKLFEKEKLIDLVEKKSYCDCILLRTAYTAVDTGFIIPDTQPVPQQYIGTVVNSMYGGNLQSIGYAHSSQVSQIIQDPARLQNELEELSNKILQEVQSSLNSEDLDYYKKSIEDLKKQIMADKPNPKFLKRAFQTIGLLGDVEGSIGLMARVWPLVYPLLQIAVEKIPQLIN